MTIVTGQMARGVLDNLTLDKRGNMTAGAPLIFHQTR